MQSQREEDGFWRASRSFPAKFSRYMSKHSGLKKKQGEVYLGREKVLSNQRNSKAHRHKTGLGFGWSEASAPHPAGHD